MPASQQGKRSSFRGGQFGPAWGGQFAPADTG